MLNSAWYLHRYPDVAGSGLTALEDYLGDGVQLGRDPGPLFSTRWYLARNPDVAAAGINPLEHYLSHGCHELRDPSPVFNTAWYFATYPSARATGFDARIHYCEIGAFVGYSPCPLFDSQWYLDTHPEVAVDGINPLLHYLTEGATKGFDPCPGFNTRDYLAANPVVAASGDNPLVHYLAGELSQNHHAGLAIVSPVAPLSRAAIADAQALIVALAPIEPCLAALPKALNTLTVVTFTPDQLASAWRKLYLSIYDVPKRLVLVGSIDKTPELLKVLKDTSGTLVIETDTKAVSTAQQLPAQTEWRSLSEFATDLDADDRVKLVVGLVNGLQPADLLVCGSRAGWEMIARHGVAISSKTATAAVAAASPELSAADLIASYFRSCIAAIRVLYATDLQGLRRTATLFGLPSGEYRKLRDLNELL